MPLDAKKIQDLRRKICLIEKARRKEDAMEEIAKLDTKISLPVLLEIMMNISSKLAPDDASKPYVDYGIRNLTDADEKQNIPLFSKAMIDMLKSLKVEKIKSDLQTLVEGLKRIEVAAETLALWEETSVWLHGIYKRTYNRVPKEKDKITIKLNKQGEVDPIDLEDRLLRAYIKGGLSKIVIASYYLHAAEALDNKIKLYRQSVAVPEKTPALPVEMTLFEVKSHKFDHFTQLTVTIPEEQEDRVDDLMSTINKMMSLEIEVEQTERDVPAEVLLENYKNESEEIRFSILIYALDHCKLNETQKASLNQFKEVIKAKLDSYITRPFSTFGLPTVFYSRPHVEEVKEKNEEIELSKEPADYSKSLFSLWADANSKNSRDVKRKTTKLLDSIYTIILKSSQPMPQTAMKFRY